MPPPDSSFADESVATPIRLQSADLSVDVLPANGGRVASIRCKHTGTEFLLGGSSYNARAEFSNREPFERSDCAGMDECLPTVSLSSHESIDVNAPDHGDLWRHAWNVVDQNEHRAVLATRCFSLPLSFRRALSVEGAHLRFDYGIGNLAQAPVPFLYACHPLFAFDSGDHLILPSEIHRLRLHYSLKDRVGQAGEWIDWPVAIPRDEQIVLDNIGEAPYPTAEMLYTNPLSRGICALYRAQRRQAIVMHFDTGMLPYLGLWVCNGGWPQDPAMTPQYAVAMEPTVAPCGSLAEAVVANLAPILNPGEHFDFSISMEILGCDRPWSYEQVTKYINSP